MNNSTTRLSKFFNLSLLLIPGFLNAGLALLLSSNRLFPQYHALTFFVLNSVQLQSFGITIAKYGIDQMLFAKLEKDEKVESKDFFLKRVFPLTLFFCLYLCFVKQFLLAAFFLFVIPVEVFVIVVICELYISKKYYRSLALNLLGQPLIYAGFALMAIFFKPSEYQILLVFLLASGLRLILALIFRTQPNKRTDVLILSPQVPVQQTSNYLMYKADQVIIASNLIQHSFLFNFNLPIDYLFYTKFTEAFSGIAVSLSPVVANLNKGVQRTTSIFSALKHKYYIFVCFAMVGVQILGTLIILKHIDFLHLALLLPFCIHTLLIVPVNMINFEAYRKDQLKKVNRISFYCFGITALLILCNIIFQSTILFACIVPVQLGMFVFLYHNKSKQNV